MNKIIVVSGPTASGKTALAVELATVSYTHLTLPTSDLV